MDYIDFVKKYEGIDKSVLLLLALGYNGQEVATKLRTTRQNVSRVIKKNKELITDIQQALKGLVSDEHIDN